MALFTTQVFLICVVQVYVYSNNEIYSHIMCYIIHEAVDRLFYPSLGDNQTLFVKNPFSKFLVWLLSGKFKLDDCYNLVLEEDTACVCGVQARHMLQRRKRRIDESHPSCRFTSKRYIYDFSCLPNY